MQEISTGMQEISDASLPHQSSVDISDDLPKNVFRIINEGSSPSSMEFHPEKQTVLLGLLIRIYIFSSIFWDKHPI